MIINIDANGDIIEQEYTNVVQGDNNANKIYLVAPLASNAVVNISFELPNGFVTEQYTMGKTMELDTDLNVWVKSIVDVPITEYYGLVKFQIRATVNGTTIAVARGKFKVDEGVDWQLPEQPTSTVYTDILTAISSLAGDVLNKVDIDYTNDGQTVEQQIINNANGLKFVKTVDEDTTTVEIKADGLYVDDVKILDNTEVQNLFNQTAGRKYPLGSTTGTGEIFNDYENNVASGDYSHAEGSYTVASANYAHAEGSGATASGATSHAEGSRTTASGGASHAEGINTTASGRFSHAGGGSSKALNDYSFAHGEDVSTSAKHQAVFGVYNVDDEDALFIVGNGELGLTEQESTKSNAFVVKKDGTIYGGNNKQLATQEYIGTVAATKQDKIDSSHKLNADLVDDATTTNKFVTSSEKAQITTNANDIADIEDLIPNQASSENQLADKNFVNSSINSVAAYYITKNAQGDPFATHAELVGASVYYSGGEVRVPTRNDYAIVLADETKTDAVTGENPTTRYSYQNGQWEFQYIVNKTALTAAQLAAINSGITSGLVTQIDTNTTNIAKKVDKSTDGYYTSGAVVTSLEGTVTNSSGRVGIASKGFEISLTDGRQYFNINEIKVTESGVDINVNAGARVNGNHIETQNNKVTSLSSLSTDTEYPTAKCVYDAINSAIITTLNTPV